MTDATVKPEKVAKKKREPAYVRRVTISIPLDPKRMGDSLKEAEDAFNKIASVLPTGTQIKVADGSPLGHME